MAATREALAKSSAIPTIDFDVEDAIDIPVYNPVKEAIPYKAPRVQVDSGYNPFETSSYKKPEFDWSKLYNDFEEDRTAIRQDSELIESFFRIFPSLLSRLTKWLSRILRAVCSTMSPIPAINIKENIS